MMRCATSIAAFGGRAAPFIAADLTSLVIVGPFWLAC
jgi:hypothetical protein